jgi:hypothetical protein
MIPLTLGWSAGAIACGQLMTASREKPFSILGSILLTVGSGLALVFSGPGISVFTFSGFLALAGIGMGCVTIPTLLLVQKSVPASDLGVATASQNFARTLGGTIGIGISGGLVTTNMAGTLDALINSSLKDAIPASLVERIASNVESLFQPQIQAQLTPTVQEALRRAIGGSVEIVFWSALATSLISLLLCCFLPDARKREG